MQLINSHSKMNSVANDNFTPKSVCTNYTLLTLQCRWTEECVYENGGGGEQVHGTVPMRHLDMYPHTSNKCWPYVNLQRQ